MRFWRNLCNKPTTSCFFGKCSRPEGAQVNSRGRAALREAHGRAKQTSKTLKGPDNQPSSTLSGSDRVTKLIPRASRKAARPRLHLHPFRMVWLRLNPRCVIGVICGCRYRNRVISVRMRPKFGFGFKSAIIPVKPRPVQS